MYGGTSQKLFLSLKNNSGFYETTESSQMVLIAVFILQTCCVWGTNLSKWIRCLAQENRRSVTRVYDNNKLRSLVKSVLLSSTYREMRLYVKWIIKSRKITNVKECWKCAILIIFGPRARFILSVNSFRMMPGLKAITGFVNKDAISKSAWWFLN